MTTLIIIAIIWGMIFSTAMMVVGWRVVHALEDLAQAQTFIANTGVGKADQPADSSG